MSIGLKANTIVSLVGGTFDAGQAGDKELFDDLAGAGEVTIGVRPLNPSNIKHMGKSGGVSSDTLLEALRKLGLVLGQSRQTAMGSGYDIRCPWVDEHTDRAETGTVYVPGAGKFKCQHGHCIDRTVEDLRLKLDEKLRDAGHTGGLIHEEFDVVDPKHVPVPPQGTKAKIETSFFDRFVMMGGRNIFYDLRMSREATATELDAGWTRNLINVLPRVTTGKVTKPMLPSRWLREKGRTVSGLIGWPGMPKVLAPDPGEPGQLFVNTWTARKRPHAGAAEIEVDEKAVALWLNVYWHVVGWDSAEQWEIGEMILDWLALVLGDMSIKAGWQVLITGQQGIGKDSVMIPIAQTLGSRWARTVQSQQFGTDFNEWAGGRLVQVSETKQNTRGSLTGHDVMNILKAVFDNSRQWMTINPKYMPKYECRNVVMGWFTSNDRDPLRLEEGDRRFLVLDRYGTKPLGGDVYARLHDWLMTPSTSSSPGAVPMTGTERVAEFLMRRWDRMDAGRRKKLLAVAPMTEDKRALLERLGDPVEDWLRRTIALDPLDQLSIPDIVTAMQVHSRLSSAIKTGGEGLPGGTGLPTLWKVGQHLRNIGGVALNGGKQVRIKSGPTVLWALRNAGAYKMLDHAGLVKLFASQTAGTSTAIN